MIDKKEFNRMASELSGFNEKREEIIKTSRDILKFSKQSIYYLHRDEFNYAKKGIDQAKKLIGEVKAKIKKDASLNTIGAFNAALQEYVEATTYYDFLKKGVVPSKKDVGVDTENYLLGICDLTGELARKAIFYTIDKKFGEVRKIHKTVSEVYEQFLKFNFRNSELRKKSDSIKYNLKKIEEVLYDIKTKKLE
ncbi:hypothetical protein GOV05_04550 [Candidatus Woesearchaeota archaeon]|nr:hypothetical protein [Candidatus Woesearchaeota archaeon]